MSAIVRWLERLRDWWHAPMIARLALIEQHMLATRAALGRPAVAAPVERLWDCGHMHTTGAATVHAPGDDDDIHVYRGQNECIDCHQARVA